MRIAFLVLAHTNPAQIKELIARLETGGQGRVFVHYDRKSQDDISCIDDWTIKPRISVHHGGYSIVAATLQLMHTAQAEGGFDYYMLLSGQCFAVNDMDWLSNRLLSGKLYINYYRMPVDLYAKRLDRLEYFHFEGAGRTLRLANRIAKKLPKRNFVKGMSMWPCAGSQWWCLPAEVVRYTLDYVDRFPSYSRFMRTTSYPDEVFFHSIISNMALEDRIERALFYARFDRRTGRPVVFGTPEAPIDEIPRDRVFVARKFDTRLSDGFLQALPVSSSISSRERYVQSSPLVLGAN